MYPAIRRVTTVHDTRSRFPVFKRPVKLLTFDHDELVYRSTPKFVGKTELQLYIYTHMLVFNRLLWVSRVTYGAYCKVGVKKEKDKEPLGNNRRRWRPKRRRPNFIVTSKKAIATAYNSSVILPSVFRTCLICQRVDYDRFG